MSDDFFIVSRCEHCHLKLDRKIESRIYQTEGVMHYFCSAECYEKAVDAMLEPHYRKDAKIADNPEIIREAETWKNLVSEEFLMKMLQDKYDSWKEDKDFKTRRARMDLKSRIDQQYWDKAQAAQKLKNEDEEREYRYQSDLLKIERKRIEENSAYWIKWWEKYDKDYVAAHYEHEHILSREEALREKEREQIQRLWDKDYANAEGDHADFLEAEAFQQALKPKPIPPHIRFEHTHILGPSGSGKTSLIQQLFLHDLPNRNAYVIIDPKGEMVARLSRLDIPSIVIDPTKDPLPALDLFHQGSQSPRVRNQLIEMFAYIFSTAKAQLTQKQSIPFEYLVRLVFHMGGNIDTLMDMLEDNAKDRRFYPFMQQLGEQDRGARRFFENDFYSTGFNETRQQIKTRLYEIISKPELMECPPSALMRQIGRVEEGRISGSS